MKLYVTNLSLTKYYCYLLNWALLYRFAVHSRLLSVYVGLVLIYYLCYVYLIQTRSSCLASTTIA